MKAGAKKLRPKPKKVEPVLFMEDEEDDSEDHDGPHRNAVEGKDDDEGEGGDPAINYYEEQLNDAGRELDAAQNDGRVKKGSSNKLNKPLAGGAGKQRLDADLAPRKPGKDGKWYVLVQPLKTSKRLTKSMTANQGWRLESKVQAKRWGGGCHWRRDEEKPLLDPVSLSPFSVN